MMPPAPRAVKLLLSSLTVLLISLWLIHPAAGGPLVPRADDSKSCGSRMCLTARALPQGNRQYRTDNNSTTPSKPSPKHYGVLVPRAIAPLDVFGPLEVFQALSRQTYLRLSLLGRTLDPVTSEPSHSAMNRFNSSFFPAVVPTHTYADDPPIDVLLIPGGPVARSPDLGPEIEYIKKVFPRLQYLITICTGASIAAQAGVLDGHRATTNKAAWKTVTDKGPKVKWVSPARWVEDGKIWSSSGVTSGIDLAFAFVKAKYENGAAIAETAAGTMEHTIITDWRQDPWADFYKVPPSN